MKVICTSFLPKSGASIKLVFDEEAAEKFQLQIKGEKTECYENGFIALNRFTEATEVTVRALIKKYYENNGLSGFTGELPEMADIEEDECVNQ